MQGLRADLTVKFDLNMFRTNTGLPRTIHGASLERVLNYTFGTTGALKVDQQFHDWRTLAASGTENLDLSGVLTNKVYETAIVFARLFAVIFSLPDVADIPADLAATTQASSITIGGTVANVNKMFFTDSSDALTLPKTGVFAVAVGDANGVTVTAATADIVKVTNNDGTNSAKYLVSFLGRTT